MKDRLFNFKEHFPFLFSLVSHSIFFIFLISQFDINANLFVFENSKNTSVIQASVINALSLSLPLPQKITPNLPKNIISKPIPEKKTQTVAIKLKPKVKPNPKLLLKDFEKEMKALAAKNLAKQVKEEQSQLNLAKAQHTQGVVNKYKALILQIISQNWLVPHQVDKKRFAELMIRVAPGGAVLEVQLIKSSGDPMLDTSAKAAVIKSSPLPVPSESQAFEEFRQFILKVKPENILSTDSWIN